MECVVRNVCGWLFRVLGLFHLPGCLVTSKVGDKGLWYYYWTNDWNPRKPWYRSSEEKLEIFNWNWNGWCANLLTMDILSRNIVMGHLAHFIDRKDSWAINYRTLRIVLTSIFLSELLMYSSLLDFTTLSTFRWIRASPIDRVQLPTVLIGLSGFITLECSPCIGSLDYSDVKFLIPVKQPASRWVGTLTIGFIANSCNKVADIPFLLSALLIVKLD